MSSINSLVNMAKEEKISYVLMNDLTEIKELVSITLYNAIAEAPTGSKVYAKKDKKLGTFLGLKVLAPVANRLKMIEDELTSSITITRVFGGKKADEDHRIFALTSAPPNMTHKTDIVKTKISTNADSIPSYLEDLDIDKAIHFYGRMQYVPSISMKSTYFDDTVCGEFYHVTSMKKYSFPIIGTKQSYNADQKQLTSKIVPESTVKANGYIDLLFTDMSVKPDPLRIELAKAILNL